MGHYPARFLVGTAKSFAGSIRNTKVEPEVETGWGRFVGDILDKAEKRNRAKRAKEQFAKKHRVSFSD